MELKALENGPILVSFENSDQKVALCRCGQTKNEQGFCDGTHRQVGFTAVALSYDDKPQEVKQCCGSGETCCSQAE